MAPRAGGQETSACRPGYGGGEGRQRRPCSGSASKTPAQRSAAAAAGRPGSLPGLALLGFPALLGKKELRWEGPRAEGLSGAAGRAWSLSVRGHSAALPCLGTLGLQEEEPRPGGGGLGERQGGGTWGLAHPLAPCQFPSRLPTLPALGCPYWDPPGGVCLLTPPLSGVPIQAHPGPVPTPGLCLWGHQAVLANRSTGPPTGATATQEPTPLDSTPASPRSPEVQGVPHLQRACSLQDSWGRKGWGVLHQGP